MKNGKYLNLALVGCLEQGLAIVDITDPSKPQWLYTLDTPGRVIGLDVDRESGLVVLSDSSSGLRVVDIHNMDLQNLSTSVRDLGSVDMGSPTKGGIVLKEGLVYVTTLAGVRVVELPSVDVGCGVDQIYIEDGEHRLPLLPGESVTAKAITNPVGLSVSWSIEERDRGVRAFIDVSSGVITAEDNTESGWIKIRASDSEVASCYKEERVYIGCSKCSQSGVDCQVREGSGFCTLSSVDFRLSLGRARGGQSAGDLFLRADKPSEKLSTPQALEFSTLVRNIEALYDSGGSLRQVLAPRSLVDIVVENDFRYDINFYRPDDITGRKNGFYETNLSAVPFVVWRIENPDASSNLYNRLKITEFKDNTTKASEYIWDEDQSTWSLSKGNGLLIETREEEWDATSNSRVVTHMVKDGSNKVASRIQTTYHEFPWGEETIKVVEDPDGSALTTITTYEDTGMIGSYGRIQSQVNPDGSWVRYQYDDQGRKIKEVRPWLDAPIDAPEASVRSIYYDYIPVDGNDAEAPRDVRLPRTVTEKIQGTTVSKTYYSYLTNEFGERVEIVERCVNSEAFYGDQSNQRTVSTYYPSGTDRPDSGQIKSILYPDGRIDTYTYKYGTYNSTKGSFSLGSGTDVRETIKHGTADHPEGIAYKTTMETSIRDEFGHELMREMYVYTGSGFDRIQWTIQYFDEFGRVVNVIHSDGTQTESTWSCCAKESERDARGIRKSYIYDELQRVKTEIKEGINSGTWPAQSDIYTTYSYDAAGRRLTETMSAGGLSMVTRNEYDLAGRLLRSTDSAGLVTAYSYEQGGRVTAIVRPGGPTEVTARHLDGRIKSITGTGVIPRYFDYGVNPDGTQWTLVYAGSMNSPRWEKSTADILGRTIKVERPGFTGIEAEESHYNSKGQLIRTSASGIADTLYIYDKLGTQFRSGLDIAHNGILEERSTDRINETEMHYTLLSGEWWQETVQRVYASQSDATSTTIGIQRMRLTGLGIEGKTEETVFIDTNGNQSITKVFTDRNGKTITNVTDYPDSTIDGISISVNGLLMSSQSKSEVAVTNGYDALGRRTSITDPRTGTTITHYNNKGQVDYVEDPAGNRAYYAYDPSTGHKTSEINPLNKVIRYDYNDRGQITHTWGDVTYPVRYVYDAYGQMSQMHTYRNGTNWNSDTWPADTTGTADETLWYYDEATGLLTAKDDATGKSVTYTYTFGGKLATRTWARTDGNNALVTAYSYDTHTSELLGIDYSDSTPDITFTYDRIGRLTTVADAVGTRTFAYNGSLQLESETIIGLYNEVITRTYEISGVKGRPAGFSLGPDYSVVYAYDDTGRFSSVGWDVGGIQGTARYTYLQNSDLLYQMTTDNGPRTTYTYEPKRDLRTQVKNEYDTKIISQYDYKYDAIGRRTSVMNSGQAFAAATNAFNLYAYNAHSELIESARYFGLDTSDTSNPVQSEYRSYSYDHIGNRKEATGWDNVSGNLRKSSYASNSINQYTQQTIFDGGGIHNFTYDDDGNLTSIISGTSAVRYTYNAENRLIAVAPQNPAAGDRKVEFSYDYMGRRVKKKVYTRDSGLWTDKSETLFVYDGWNMISELTTSNGKQTAKSYVWGLDLSQSLQGAGGIGGLLSMVDPSSLSTYYYLYDVNGNVAQLVNIANDEIVAHYEYDPFGNEILTNGSMAVDNPYRFSTKYLDYEDELYYYGYRYYNSSLGRWLSRDPIDEDGGIHLYGFVRNDVINSYDILGRWLDSDHARITKEAFKCAIKYVLPQHRHILNDRDYIILGRIFDGNNLQDRGKNWNEAKRHYMREPEEKVSDAIEAYKRYLEYELFMFNDFLN